MDLASKIVLRMKKARENKRRIPAKDKALDTICRRLDRVQEENAKLQLECSSLKQIRDASNHFARDIMLLTQNYGGWPEAIALRDAR